MTELGDNQTSCPVMSPLNGHRPPRVLHFVLLSRPRKCQGRAANPRDGEPAGPHGFLVLSSEISSIKIKDPFLRLCYNCFPNYLGEYLASPQCVSEQAASTRSASSFSLFCPSRNFRYKLEHLRRACRWHSPTVNTLR